MKYLLLSLFIIINVSAEYRVYEYMIRPMINQVQDNTSYTVTSALAPVSYRSYHGGNELSIDLLRTWLCPGDTSSFKKHCESPYKKLARKIAEEGEKE